MDEGFQYTPRFVDIRIKPPKPGEAEAEADVLRLKPGETPCDWPGCLRPSTAKAPKSREAPGQFYRFCQPHAAEYNKGWDWFAGMSEDEVRRLREDEVTTGGRPTWQMKAGRFSREAAAFASRFTRGAGGFADPFGMFGQGQKAEAPPSEAERRIGKLERQALADLDLEPGVAGPAIRARYTELLKRCHPDLNGGDRGAEIKLQKVIRAWKTLQKAGMT
ncbi:J domain-containing protein [Brevundimonas sp. 2R-24]|uniref:J domain-containing protein n=1 Tax=Peiella sedimenti TaxID=3061083 RepID=A0ABT8SK13_9CAUL|nr:J domain-containing protein [Caulobacteraceae bacterium XZ-24]